MIWALACDTHKVMTDEEARELAQIQRELARTEGQARAIRARRNRLIVALYEDETPVAWLADTSELGRQAIHRILLENGARIRGRAGPPPGGWPARPGL